MVKPTLVVLAAGMGSRYGGLKQVDSLGPCGETIIDYSVFDALRAGFGRVVFVVRRAIEQDFMEAFGPRFRGQVPFDLVFQELDMLPPGIACPPGRAKPWGTAHAVWVCRDAVAEPFAVINADDFYGADAYRAMHRALTAPTPRPGSYFMVGYRLANTLSEQGAVSRGVCATDGQGLLTSVVERTHIERAGGRILYRDGPRAMAPLDSQTLVSMNFWGFSPDFFAHTTQMLIEFLGGALADPKAEFYIPTVVNRLIAQGKATCQVLPSTAQWFGVTYPGDRPGVQEALRRLSAQGEYPSPLF